MNKLAPFEVLQDNKRINHKKEKIVFRTSIFMITALTSLISIVHAEPTMQGTPSQLTEYLKKLPNTVSIHVSASEKVTARHAKVSLQVVTSDKFLATALKKNSELRKEVRKLCQKAGIENKSISESKFSSTPEYGWFGDKPDAYKVNNQIEITVKNEKELIGIAGIADKNRHVYFVASKPHIENQDAIKKRLIEKALQSAEKKIAIYQKKLGMKFVPVNVLENEVTIQQMASPRRSRAKGKMESYSSASTAGGRFGESDFKLNLTVKYRVKSK